MASRHSRARAKHRGTLVLIEGCAVQIAGLAALVAAIDGAIVELPTVKPVSAGAAYGTTAQIANAVGVAAIGAVFFAIESSQSSRLAPFAALALFTLSIIACAAFLTWRRRVTE